MVPRSTIRGQEQQAGPAEQTDTFITTININTVMFSNTKGIRIYIYISDPCMLVYILHTGSSFVTTELVSLLIRIGESARTLVVLDVDG